MIEETQHKITIGFHATEEEAKYIDEMVDLSGLTKQDFILTCLKDATLYVEINPCIYLQFKTRLDSILLELKRISTTSELTNRLVEQINFVLKHLKNFHVSKEK